MSAAHIAIEAIFAAAGLIAAASIVRDIRREWPAVRATFGKAPR